MIKINCVWCNKEYNLNESLVGKLGKCKNCWTIIKIENIKTEETLKSLALKSYKASAIVAIILIIFNPFLLLLLPFFLIGIGILFFIFYFIEIWIFTRYYNKYFQRLSGAEKKLYGFITFLRCGYYIPWVYFIIPIFYPIGIPIFIQITFFVAFYVILIIGSHLIFFSSNKILTTTLTIIILTTIVQFFLKYDIAFIFFNEEFKSKYILWEYHREAPIIKPDAIQWSFEEELDKNNNLIPTWKIEGFFINDYREGVKPELEFWRMYNYKISIQKNGKEIFNWIPKWRSALTKLNNNLLKNGDIIDVIIKENLSDNTLIDLNRNIIGFKKKVIIPSNDEIKKNIPDS